MAEQTALRKREDASAWRLSLADCALLREETILATAQRLAELGLAISAGRPTPESPLARVEDLAAHLDRAREQDEAFRRALGGPA